LKHLNVHEVPIIILENVDFTGDTESLTSLLEELAQLGYVVRFRIMQAKEYGSSQRRKRFYLYGFLKQRFDVPEADLRKHLDRVDVLVNTFRGHLKPKEPSELLLDNSSPHVKAVLKQMLAAKHEDKEETEWQDKHLALLKKYSLTWTSAAVPDTHRSSPWFDVLCSREQHSLGLMLQRFPNAVVFDLYHSCGRASKSTPSSDEPDAPDSCPTVLPGSRFWMETRDGTWRLATGGEMLLLQGFPMQDLGRDFWDTPNSVLADLGGNAFDAHCYGAILLALLLVAPFGRIAHASGNDVANALDLAAHLHDDEGSSE